MTYDTFLSWCIDTSRDDREKFVSELAMRLNSLLNECRPVRRRASSKTPMPVGVQKGALKLALKSARNHLTDRPSRA